MKLSYVRLTLKICLTQKKKKQERVTTDGLGRRRVCNQNTLLLRTASPRTLAHKRDFESCPPFPACSSLPFSSSLALFFFRSVVVISKKRSDVQPAIGTEVVCRNLYSNVPSRHSRVLRRFQQESSSDRPVFCLDICQPSSSVTTTTLCAISHPLFLIPNCLGGRSEAKKNWEWAGSTTLSLLQ